jgi:hypothetical protein
MLSAIGGGWHRGNAYHMAQPALFALHSEHVGLFCAQAKSTPGLCASRHSRCNAGTCLLPPESLPLAGSSVGEGRPFIALGQ